MKKHILCILLIFCILLPLTPVAEASAPSKIWIEPNAENALPAAVTLYHEGDLWRIYLPGNANSRMCFLSWSNHTLAVCDGITYESGTLPIPQPGQHALVSFGDTTLFIATVQGSASVKPIFIEIDESLGTIAAMNSDSAHNTECSGIIYIDGERYDLPKMKGRGNATWYMAQQKRPYNITLGSKAVILGLDCKKTKKYSLLANIADPSLLRNQIGLDMAHAMGIGYDSAPADVWMNGEYQGLYLVTPKIDSYVSDTGFSVEIDNYTEPPIEQGGDPSFAIPCGNGHDDQITVKKIGKDLLGEDGESIENLRQTSGKIQSYLNDVWEAIYSDSGYNQKGIYYTEYIDIPSFAAMYLMHEYIKSIDVRGGSILFHRDGTGDTDKLIAGPLWDLDNALGATSAHDLTCADDWYIPRLSSFNNCLFKALSTHKDFMAEVTECYNRYREIFDGASYKLDSMASTISSSATMNALHVTKETYNNAYIGSTEVISAGTEYEQVYRATESWNDYMENLRTYLTVRSRFFHDKLAQDDPGYRISFLCDSLTEITAYETRNGKAQPRAGYTLARNSNGEIDLSGEGEAWFQVNVPAGYIIDSVTAEPKNHYRSLDLDTDGLAHLTGISGSVSIQAKSKEIQCPHVFIDGVCSLCGRQAYQVEFLCDEHCHVVLESDAYARDAESGMLDLSGKGQVRFHVQVEDGFKLLPITVSSPICQLQFSQTDGVGCLYNIDSSCMVTLTTRFTSPRTQNLILDFTDPDSMNLFDIVNPDTARISDGVGLLLTTTLDALEPADEQLSGDAATKPKDLIKVPVTGDWTATLEFEVDPSHAANGYYQYFSFFAAEGADLVGIRCGEAAFQDFIRKDDTIHKETRDSSPGLSEGGRYWCRIKKEGDLYTCFRSSDGETFKEIFSFANSQIEAESLLIDAYTGMTTGYDFILKSLAIEDMDCAHHFEEIVTAPTCLADGYTTHLCTLCGGKYTSDIVPAYGHDWTSVRKEASCSAAGSITRTCSRCGDSELETIPALGHDYVNGKCSRCGKNDPDLVIPGSVLIANYIDAPKEGHWAYNGICYCLEKGIMNGISETIFRPNGILTRAQFVTILYRMEGEPAISKDPNFSDVPAGQWYSKAVCWAAENQIVTGYPDHSFRPDGQITREQIAVILYRCRACPPTDTHALSGFPDKDSVSPYAVTAMNWAVSNQLITGVSSAGNTILSPKETATRAQIASIIMRYQNTVDGLST